jgi:hypothetical protein
MRPWPCLRRDDPGGALQNFSRSDSARRASTSSPRRYPHPALSSLPTAAMMRATTRPQSSALATFGGHRRRRARRSERDAVMATAALAAASKTAVARPIPLPRQVPMAILLSRMPDCVSPAIADRRYRREATIFARGARGLGVTGPENRCRRPSLTDQKERIRSVPMVKLLLLRPLLNGLAVEWS